MRTGIVTAPARFEDVSFLHGLRIVLRIGAVATGAVHALAAISAQSMNPDGIAYMEIGDAVMRGDWAASLNAYWSPLYAWVVGLCLALANPSMEWQFPTVHLINLLIYVFALIGFDFFWRQQDHALRATASVNQWLVIPGWAYWTVGYLLFIWTALSHIELWSVTPDMTVAALVYLSAGLIIRTGSGHSQRGDAAWLGVLLGVAFLTKAVMLPVGILLLALTFLVTRLRRVSVRGPLLTTALFLVVILPYVVLLSLQQGRVTFGESGKLNYVRYVNRLPDVHWQGGPPESGQPVHPTRQIFKQPAAYEFAEPVAGVYPPWHDPAYWYEGVSAYWSWQQQWPVLLANLLFYYDLFVGQQGAALFVLLVLLALSVRTRMTPVVVAAWGMAAIACAVFALYGLVYVETRYLGPFLVLCWSPLILSVRLPRTEFAQTLLRMSVWAVILVLTLNIAVFHVEGYADLSGRHSARSAPQAQWRAPRSPVEVAAALGALGVEPGSRVAVIGDSFNAFWARLLGVKIVAEIPEYGVESFWTAAPARQADVIDAMIAAGAAVIVAERVPAYADVTGWHQVNDTNYFVYQSSRIISGR